MVYNLPVAIAPGDAGHATRHNEANTAVNDLDTRVNSLESKRLFIPAASFVTVSGSPTLTSTTPTSWPAWLLDPAATEIVQAVFQAPLGWQTATAYLWWVAAFGTAGDVRFQVRYYPEKVDGALVNSGEVTLGSATVTSPAQYTLKKTLFGAAFTVQAAPAAAERPLLAVSVRRLGADALDTLTVDVGVVGVELIRAS